MGFAFRMQGSRAKRGDTVPDAFSFTDATGVAQGATSTSNTITLSGLTASTAVTISGGTYSKNSGGYASGATTAANGDTFNVRGTASSFAGETVDVVLTVGGVSDTYSITTVTPTPAITNFISKMWKFTGGGGAGEIDPSGARVGNPMVISYHSANGNNYLVDGAAAAAQGWVGYGGTSAFPLPDGDKFGLTFEFTMENEFRFQAIDCTIDYVGPTGVPAESQGFFMIDVGSGGVIGNAGLRQRFHVTSGEGMPMIDGSTTTYTSATSTGAMTIGHSPEGVVDSPHAGNQAHALFLGHGEGVSYGSTPSTGTLRFTLEVHGGITAEAAQGLSGSRTTGTGTFVGTVIHS